MAEHDGWQTFAHLSGDALNLLWMRFRDGDEMLSLADLNSDNNDDILWRDGETNSPLPAFLAIRIPYRSSVTAQV